MAVIILLTNTKPRPARRWGIASELQNPRLLLFFLDSVRKKAQEALTTLCMHSQSITLLVAHGTYGNAEIRNLFSGGSAVTVGDVVQCLAELPRGKFVWYKNGKFVIECNVPNELRDQGLFLSVFLEQAGEADIFI